jgi:hypothetical protein
MTGLGVSDSVKGFNSGSVLIKSPFVGKYHIFYIDVGL